ncbi:2-hydroxychromene-2-carboxylate isomerase [Variovorax dokdonensis]|uniref:2-hydroxychromene-2-carboxylate isomerase n=1 Tax=Variovorax dokdonensis TaxID=344883 RepID=A0ABT7N4X2_9BURK|nr:2-hydroxychromene-2-carboxylate isomerase [Variovorax dokdonensis]MDM0042994.1 2-hydroxychromene-2-carboxylate isomerase [Variovorax dokdonensis]
MKTITFHYDFLSPFAYLAFEHLPQALAGLSVHVRYRPVLLGALLRAHGLLGPAEVAHKRDWTYRQVLWQGRMHDVPIDMPAQHPFNPLPYLRLALASADGADTNRYVTETIFRDIWRGGGDPSDPARVAALAARLPRVREPDGDAVKAQLRANTDAAVRAGIFGTPTMEVDGQHFWGLDSLPVLRAWLEGDPWFEQDAWKSAGNRPAWTPPGKSQ